MIHKRNLIILDLDHTLIYGSYGVSEPSKLLFEYDAYLKIYERPFAREFIEVCKSIGDIVVYTSAKRDYAMKICLALDIQPIELLTRVHCKNTYGEYIKKIKTEWYRGYKEILIVDDSPHVWDHNKSKKISFFVPSRFMGEEQDDALIKIMSDLRSKSPSR